MTNCEKLKLIQDIVCNAIEYSVHDQEGFVMGTIYAISAIIDMGIEDDCERIGDKK